MTLSVSAGVFVISAIASGQGKTAATATLVRRLSKLALTRSLNDAEGSFWPMAEVPNESVTMQMRLAGRGAQAWMSDAGALCGHAFRYSSFDTQMEAAARTIKHLSKKQGEAIYREGRLRASCFHVHFPRCPAAVARLFHGERP